jgi:hypothetical protein
MNQTSLQSFNNSPGAAGIPIHRVVHRSRRVGLVSVNYREAAYAH